MVEIRKLSLPTKTKGTKSAKRRTVERRTMTTHPPPTPQPTPCRLWQGQTDKDGYGVWWRTLRGGKRKQYRIHCWVMEQIHGPLKAGQVVLHACDNRCCYRYDHLSIGTIQENNEDMFRKGRAVPPPVNRMMREKNPAAKLTAQQVLLIRNFFMEGVSPAELARVYGVSVRTIYNIVADLHRQGVRYAIPDYTTTAGDAERAQRTPAQEGP